MTDPPRPSRATGVSTADIWRFAAMALPLGKVLARLAHRRRPAMVGLSPCLVVSLAAVVAPRAGAAASVGDAWAAVLLPSAPWSSIWSTLLALALAAALYRAEPPLPAARERDMILMGPRAVRWLVAGLNVILALEARLGRWPVASVLLLVVCALLGGALLAG